MIRYLLMTVALMVATASGATAQPGAEPTYQPPVVAPVADPFRHPGSSYGSGNRGIEYVTDPGQSVWASSSGSVAFAGPVAGRNVVSIDHPEGLRTTYSSLLSIDVSVGQHVSGGEQIATAGPRFHFGARAGDGWINPQYLFDASSRRVRLVPVHESRR